MPSVVGLPVAPTTWDLTFDLRQQAGGFVVSSAQGKYESSQEGTHNQRIFDVLLRAVLAEFKPGLRSLKIRSRLDYVVDAINKGRIETDREALARLRFHLLRFQHVQAERI